MLVLLSHSASHGTLSVLHSLSGFLVLLGILTVEILSIPVDDGLLEILTFLVRESLDVVQGALIGLDLAFLIG